MWGPVPRRPLAPVAQCLRLAHPSNRVLSSRLPGPACCLCGSSHRWQVPSLPQFTHQGPEPLDLGQQALLSARRDSWSFLARRQVCRGVVLGLGKGMSASPASHPSSSPRPRGGQATGRLSGPLRLVAENIDNATPPRGSPTHCSPHMHKGCLPAGGGRTPPTFSASSSKSEEA